MTATAAARWSTLSGRLHHSPRRRRAGRSGRLPSPRLVARFAVAVAVATGAGAGALAGPVAGETSATLHAQAAAISATISSEDASLAALGERYLAERAVYATATQRSRQLRRQITRIAGAVGRDRADVLAAAVSAYVDSGNDASLSLLFGGTPNSLAAGQTYLRAASDQLGEVLTRLRDATHSLSVSATTERRVGQDARVALATTSADRSSVLGTVARQRRLLAGVDGRLAVLVREELLARQRAAAQAAARAQAAAAAARAAAARAAAARAAAAQASAARSGPTTTAPGRSGGTASGGGATPTTTPPAGAAPAGSAGPPAPSGVPATGPGVIPSGTLSQDFAAIRNCESSDDYSLDTGNGYYGAYQFGLGTWDGLGGTGLPSAAPPAVQDALAYRLYQRSGWSPWPECSAIIGL